MAGKGGRWLAELLRGPDQHPVPIPISLPPEANVALHLAPQIAKGPLQPGPDHNSSEETLAQADNSTPVAGSTTCRQLNPREKPDALTGTSGSARGALGNRRPYRNHRDHRCDPGGGCGPGGAAQAAPHGASDLRAAARRARVRGRLHDHEGLCPGPLLFGTHVGRRSA